MVRCCNKKATPYHRVYQDKLGREHSWEEGLRCKKCGRIRIPDGKPIDGSAYLREVEAIRARLILEGEPDVN